MRMTVDSKEPSHGHKRELLPGSPGSIHCNTSTYSVIVNTADSQVLIVIYIKNFCVLESMEGLLWLCRI